MNYLSRIRLFFKSDISQMLLFFEAFFLLGVARLIILFPFSIYSHLLGKHMDETKTTNYFSPEQIQKLKNIKDAVQIMSKYTFWESKCLVKAICAMIMLKGRHIESTLYLGTAKEEGELIAHAWLRSGHFYVTGADVMKKFTVVAKFAKK